MINPVDGRISWLLAYRPQSSGRKFGGGAFRPHCSCYKTQEMTTVQLFLCEVGCKTIQNERLDRQFIAIISERKQQLWAVDSF